MSNPVHGNYHGYYTKRPSYEDARLALLPPNFFSGKAVLDVGCNEGLVTCEIAQRGARKVVGVDIDKELIKAAWSRRRKYWSIQEPPRISSLGHSSTKKRRYEESDTNSSLSSNYFPASLAHTYGPLPILPSLTSDANSFPHNLIFRTADWVRDGVYDDKECYDIVVVFSVTKWIHLNGRDNALRSFFVRIYDVLRPGGKLVLEPQPWGSYPKASKMSPTLKENILTLELRPDDFPSVLRKIGFSGPDKMGEAGEAGSYDAA